MKVEKIKEIHKGIRLKCPAEKIIMPKKKRKEKHKKDFYDDIKEYLKED
jgi:hypothetical protein